MVLLVALAQEHVGSLQLFKFLVPLLLSFGQEDVRTSLEFYIT